MKGEEAFDEFHREIIKEKAAENIEILFIDVSEYLFTYIIDKSDFNLAKPEQGYGKSGFRGWFEGYKIFVKENIDGQYDIKTKTLWKMCPECLNRKMYDERNEVHYCPICDNRRARFKDKLFNVLR